MSHNFTINKDIKFEEYKSLYEKDKIITITDFLKEEDALKLNNYLESVKDDEWNISMHPYMSQWYTFAMKDHDKEFIQKGIMSAKSAFDRNEFSYVFKRKDLHGEHCQCVMCAYMVFLNSDLMKFIISNLIGKRMSSSISTFATKYDKDCFLSIHSDLNRGTAAFVYNLSKDWNKEDGGCFRLLTPDFSKVKKEVVPTFNSLTIFYVEDGNAPHQVLPVMSETKSRYAISGWYV